MSALTLIEKALAEVQKYLERDAEEIKKRWKKFILKKKDKDDKRSV